MVIHCSGYLYNVNLIHLVALYYDQVFLVWLGLGYEYKKWLEPTSIKKKESIFIYI